MHSKNIFLLNRGLLYYIASGWKSAQISIRHSSINLGVQAHFSSALPPTIPSTVVITEHLPELIEQQCQKWKKILEAEKDAQQGKYQWTRFKLPFIDVKSGPNDTNSRLLVNINNLDPRDRQYFAAYFKIGTPVELRPLYAYNVGNTQLCSTLRGYIRNKFDNMVSILLQGKIGGADVLKFKHCSFAIRKTPNESLFESQMEFINKRREWHQMPGYGAMLVAYKCKSLSHDEASINTEIAEKDLDQSTKMAIFNASLMLQKRPIVAIHGTPEMGKTQIIVEFLHNLSIQGKRSLVVTKSVSGLYQLMAEYIKLANITKNNGNFFCLQRIDKNVLEDVVTDKRQRNLIESSAFLESMFEKQHFGYTDQNARKAEYKRINELTRGLIQSGGLIAFATLSRSMLNMLKRCGIAFDVVVLDDAAKFTELEAWWITLPLAPSLRLFGDYNQSRPILYSSMSTELGFYKSLLQRLGEEFGHEMNFRL